MHGGLRPRFPRERRAAVAVAKGGWWRQRGWVPEQKHTQRRPCDQAATREKQQEHARKRRPRPLFTCLTPPTPPPNGEAATRRFLMAALVGVGDSSELPRKLAPQLFGNCRTAACSRAASSIQLPTLKSNHLSSVRLGKMATLLGCMHARDVPGAREAVSSLRATFEDIKKRMSDMRALVRALEWAERFPRK
jgi:hypothetical protein